MPDQRGYNEKELLLLLINGNEFAFEQIYKLYSREVLANLNRLVKSKTIALDLLQETFIRLWNNRNQVEGYHSVRSYLYRIAENLAFDFFRKAARDEVLKKELIKKTCEEYEHIVQAIELKQNTQILYCVIDQLPVQRQQVFRLIKLEGKSYNEVSEKLNISPSTISDHIVKATKFIRQQLLQNKEMVTSFTAVFLSIFF